MYVIVIIVVDEHCEKLIGNCGVHSVEK